MFSAAIGGSVKRGYPQSHSSATLHCSRTLRIKPVS